MNLSDVAEVEELSEFQTMLARLVVLPPGGYRGWFPVFFETVVWYYFWLLQIQISGALNRYRSWHCIHSYWVPSVYFSATELHLQTLHELLKCEWKASSSSTVSRTDCEKVTPFSPDAETNVITQRLIDVRAWAWPPREHSSLKQVNGALELSRALAFCSRGTM